MYNIFFESHTEHYGDVIMGAIASQITSLTIVHSTLYSDADQRKHQISASLVFVRGIHPGPLNSPHKWPVTRKMFPFDDVIMKIYLFLMSKMMSNDYGFSWHYRYVIYKKSFQLLQRNHIIPDVQTINCILLATSEYDVQISFELSHRSYIFLVSKQLLTCCWQHPYLI